eukprot:scaffold2010_cov301-Prasinococcus_capsulatus_cf.AAC.17
MSHLRVVLAARASRVEEAETDATAAAAAAAASGPDAAADAVDAPPLVEVCYPASVARARTAAAMRSLGGVEGVRQVSCGASSARARVAAAVTVAVGRADGWVECGRMRLLRGWLSWMAGCTVAPSAALQAEAAAAAKKHAEGVGLLELNLGSLFDGVARSRLYG